MARAQIPRGLRCSTIAIKRVLGHMTYRTASAAGVRCVPFLTYPIVTLQYSKALKIMGLGLSNDFTQLRPFLPAPIGKPIGL